jgi:hypothetical protein
MEPDELEVYDQSLPPTLPVVHATIDMLSSLASSQRRFLVQHADKVKLELFKERQTTVLPQGAWALNGFELGAELAVDLIRASPDTLSNLTFLDYKNEQTLWERLMSWLNVKDSTEIGGMSVVDDLAFALTVAEVVEVSGHVLAATAAALSVQAPRLGKPLVRALAYELASSRHRGASHAMYLCMDVVHETKNVTGGRTGATLTLALSLNIHKPLLLGGAAGVAVNVSGVEADDLPEADLDRSELRALLARKGTFVASSVSDFVLDPDKPGVDSDRVATIALHATRRLQHAANETLAAFLGNETRKQEAVRARQRAAEREAAEAAAAEAAEREARERMEREEREATERLLLDADRMGDDDGVGAYRDRGAYRGMYRDGMRAPRRGGWVESTQWR